MITRNCDTHSHTHTLIWCCLDSFNRKR